MQPFTTRWKCAMLHCKNPRHHGDGYKLSAVRCGQEFNQIPHTKICALLIVRQTLFAQLFKHKPWSATKSDHDKIKYGRSSLEDLN